MSSELRFDQIAMAGGTDLLDSLRGDAKSWCYHNAITEITLDSYNVSSITYVSTGKSLFGLINPMIAIEHPTFAGIWDMWWHWSHQSSTTTYQHLTYNSSDVASWSAHTQCALMGDLA